MNRFNPIESLANLRHEFGEHGGVNMSIEASTTFTVMHADTMPEIFHGQLGPDTGGCFLYGRHFNPTVYTLGRELAAIEGTEAAYCSASGMSAIACTIMQLCGHGDHIIAGDTLYGGTFAILHDYLPAKAGLDTTFVHITDHDGIEAAFTDRTRVLYVETMTNPTLVVADIPKLAEIAHGHGATLVVDNTFCPMVVSPAQLGADVVVYSLTKFVNGASDCIAGAICGEKSFIMSLMDLHTGSLMLLGPTMDPQTAYDVSLRLPHLGIRMKEHSRRAQVFAERLLEQKIPVVYPGLPSHPTHEILKRIGNAEFGFGGLLGIDLGTSERAFKFMETLQNKDRFGYMAVSLGYFDTLMSCSGSSTSSELSDDDQRRAGISPGYVRLSIGFTGSLEQRWNQLRDALQVVGLL